MTRQFADWLKSGNYVERSNGQRIFLNYVRGAGKTVLFLHGFPTSSFDWSEVFEKVEGQAQLLALDFLGFGASDKPLNHKYNYIEQADVVCDIAKHLAVDSCVLVAHNYAVTVAQELMRRQNNRELAFELEHVLLLNGGIYQHLHRPSATQKVLLTPLVGAVVANRMTESRFIAAFSKIFTGAHKLSPEDAHELWKGIAMNDGYKLAPKLLHYIRDRKLANGKWEEAMENSRVPLTLLWGLKDPISGKHVLDFARQKLPRASIIELPEVSHYPQLEQPDSVAKTILNCSDHSSLGFMAKSVH